MLLVGGGLLFLFLLLLYLYCRAATVIMYLEPVREGEKDPPSIFLFQILRLEGTLPWKYVETGTYSIF